MNSTRNETQMAHRSTPDTLTTRGGPIGAFVRPTESAAGVVAIRARRTPNDGWLEVDVIRETDPISFERVFAVFGVDRHRNVVTSCTLLGPRHVTVYVRATETPAAWCATAPTFFDREDASLYLHVMAKLQHSALECPGPGPHCSCTHGMGLEWQYEGALEARLVEWADASRSELPDMSQAA